jgi:hypothetical protein
MLGKFLDSGPSVFDVPRIAEHSTRLKDVLSGHMKYKSDHPALRDGKVRISSLSQGFCPRAMVLSHTQGLMRTEDITADKAWIFGVGKAYNFLLQNEVMPCLPGWRGRWRCKGCGFVHGDEKLGSVRPKACKCHCTEFEYVELYAENEELSGHIDGVIDWGGKGLIEDMEVQEFKTINTRGFVNVNSKNFKPPMPEHVVQCSAYCMLLGIGRGRITYFEKSDRSLGQVMAEHAFVYDSKVTDPLVKLLKYAFQCLKDSKLPRRATGCALLKNERPQQCFCAGPCFSS